MKRRTDQTLMTAAQGIAAATLLMLFLAGIGLAQSGSQRALRKVDPQNPSSQSDELRGPATGRQLPRIARQLRPGIDFSQQGLGKPQAAALNRAFQELDLTEEQKARIRQAWGVYVAQVRRLNNVRRAKAIVFDDSLYGNEFDPADAEKKAADLAATESELLRNQMKIVIDIRQVLSPAQGAKFKQILEEERLRARRSLLPNPNVL